MRRLLKIGLLLLPVFIIPITINDIHINIRDARELLFQSIAIIALGIVIRNKWIKWFLVWCVANWWFNYFLPPQATAVLFNIFFGFLLFYLIKEFIKPNDVDGILKVICWTALFQVLWLGIQALGKDFVFFPIASAGYRMEGNVALVGFLGNTNLLGAYLALCVVLFRVYYKKLLIIILIGLVVARSSAAMLGAFSGLLCFEVLMAVNKKRFGRLVVVSIMCLISIILFFMFVDSIGFDRFAIWKQTVIQSLNWRCLIGQGLGRFQNLVIIDKTGTPWDNPHNEYLQVYFELGLVGILLVFGYFIDLFRRFLKRTNEKTILLFSCVVVLLVNAIGNFPFQIAPTAFLGITYIALLERLCHPQRHLLKI